MTRKILLTNDKKRIVIDTDTDTRIYQSPVNPPNTGQKYTYGTDIYAHKAQSANVFFYSCEWSMWQGSETQYSLLEREEVETFLVNKAGSAGWDELTEDETETAKKYGFDIFTENA